MQDGLQRTTETGCSRLVWPYWDAPVHHTDKGTPYLEEPGVALLAQTITNPTQMRPFLYGFDPIVDFEQYLEDNWEGIDHGTALMKIMGQLCYMAFGANRTKNSGAPGYVRNVYQQGHGSLIEHPNFTVLFYGVSRTFTHELVRHRAGFAFSQVSQRYVDGSKLRFVMRPEFKKRVELRRSFYELIDSAAEQYERFAEELCVLLRQEHPDLHTKFTRTEIRKMTNQAARAVLPNCTEAPIGVTANVRAWHHFFNMRGSVHAEPEIRRAAVRTFHLLVNAAPTLFQDIEVTKLKDGTEGLQVEFSKV